MAFKKIKIKTVKDFVGRAKYCYWLHIVPGILQIVEKEKFKWCVGKFRQINFTGGGSLIFVVLGRKDIEEQRDLAGQKRIGKGQ